MVQAGVLGLVLAGAIREEFAYVEKEFLELVSAHKRADDRGVRGDLFIPFSEGLMRHEYAGICFGGKHDIGVVLVVLKFNIVLGLVLFDELVFQDKGAFFIGCFYEINAGNLGIEVGEIPLRAEVGSYAFAYVDRLPDVDDLLLRVLEEIHAGGGGERCNDVFQMIRHSM